MMSRLSTRVSLVKKKHSKEIRDNPYKFSFKRKRIMEMRSMVGVEERAK